MRTQARLAIMLAALAAGVVAVGSALAAYTTPRLLVTDNRTGPVTIDFTQSGADDPTAKVQIFVPSGYAATLTQAAGTTIGTVSAVGTAADLGGALLPLTGTIQVRAASGTYSSGGSQVPLSAAATQCTGTATHTAYWVLVLQAAGQTLELPAFADEVTAAPTSAFAKATVQFCLPPPDLPAGTPGRATFGFKLTRAALALNNVFTSSGDGEFRWRATATPYDPGTGRAAPTRTVEVQSVVAFPRTARLAKPTVRVAKRVATIRVAGTLVLPAGDRATVRVYRGARAVTAAQVTGSSFAATFRVRQTNRRQTFTLQARATVPQRDLGAQGCTATFGLQCTSATKAGYTLRSNTIRVVVPARPKR
jgi:hypothetical protein